MTCIPRAIAPLSTTTPSPPAAWRRATSSQTRASTLARSMPVSSATMLEPSLMTKRAIAPGLSRMQLEHDAPDLDVVARLEPGRLERAHDAHPVQAPLDVRQRLLVVEVVAGEQPRALDVRKEVVPEPGALARALDEPWDVGQDELAVVAVQRAEHRLERRERVAGHLRGRAGQPREQRRLARVRHPDEPDVGQQLEAQLDPA